MKTIQPSDLDPCARTDKELESWTLSWQPEGRCGSFTREAILIHAPATSGVYGLFNFNCQIFIGEAENIRDVLLRVENEPDFQSEQSRPTGFTFELCSEELRKTKAAELIARFRPVLQTTAWSNEAPAVENPPAPIDRLRRGHESRADSDNHEFPSHGDTVAQIQRRLQLRQRWDVTLATALIASGVIIYVAKSAPSPQNPVSGAAEKSPGRVESVRASVSSKVELVSKRQTVASKDATGARPQKIIEANPPKVDVHPYTLSQNGEVRLAATKAPAVDEAGVQKLVGAANTIPPAGANSGKKWSVQISAAPAKDVADNLVQRLAAKGYNGYVAQVEVKGQTYYRVRVGPFDARDEAEAARQSLARQEEYRDAYLTGD